MKEQTGKASALKGVQARRVGMGVVGLGMAGAAYSEAILGYDRACLLGVTTRTWAKAEEFALRWNTRAHRDLDELLADPHIEAVVIASPTQYHYEQTVRALEAGKHVLVEKPVAETVEDVLRLHSLAQARDLVCIPAHNTIYPPAVREAKRWIEEGRLGTIAYASFAASHHIPRESLLGWRAGMRREGALFDSGTHLVYTALYLLGRPIRLSAMMARLHYTAMESLQDDMAVLTLQYPNGALATILQSWAAPYPMGLPSVLGVNVLGKRGGLWLSHSEAVAYTAENPMPDGLDPVAYTARVTSLGPGLQYQESFKFLVQQFVACVQEGLKPLSSLGDAAVALAIIEKAYASAATGETFDLGQVKTGWRNNSRGRRTNVRRDAESQTKVA